MGEINRNPISVRGIRFQELPGIDDLVAQWFELFSEPFSTGIDVRQPCQHLCQHTLQSSLQTKCTQLCHGQIWLNCLLDQPFSVLINHCDSNFSIQHFAREPIIQLCPKLMESWNIQLCVTFAVAIS